jgi:hypothetical protein
VGSSDGNELPLAPRTVKTWKRRRRGKASRRSISRFRPWPSTAALDSLSPYDVAVLVLLLESMLGSRQARQGSVSGADIPRAVHHGRGRAGFSSASGR